ncbi:MAG TPA: hypothetical protein VL860_08940 [Planctomycetota bacterium]|nr:hypothetical protein [Planctomycetota bacterium]
MVTDPGSSPSTGASGRASSGAHRAARPKTARRSARATAAPPSMATSPDSTADLPVMVPVAKTHIPRPPTRSSRPLTNRGPGSYVDPQPGVRPLTSRRLAGKKESGVHPPPQSAQASQSAPLAQPPSSAHSSRPPRALSSHAGGRQPVQPAGSAVPAPHRDLDVSDEFRSHRATASQKNKSFAIVFLAILAVLLMGALSAAAIYNHTHQPPYSADDKLQFETWLRTSLTSMATHAGQRALALKPVYTDLPDGAATPELAAALEKRYAPALQATEASPAWCRKNWRSRDRDYSWNTGLPGLKDFLMQPAHAAPLSDPTPLSNINGEANQSALVTIFWDADRKKPVAVVQLNLAPPTPVVAPDAPAVRPIPASQFTLFYDLPALPDGAQRYLDFRLNAPAGAP